MKPLHTSIFSLVILASVIMPSPSLAVNVCALPDSDSDGDGWGWENDSSCLVDPDTATQQPPICELETSDPDGDGWGWENDASCRIEAPMTSVPGSSIATATSTSIGSALTNTLTDDTETHWYSFDIEGSDFAYVLSDNRENPHHDITIKLEDSSGTALARVEPGGLAEQSGALCLNPGRYYLSANAFLYPDDSSATYNVSLNVTNLRCASPEYTVSTDSFTDAFTTITGGYVYASTRGEVVAVTHNGLPLWTVDNILDGYITGIVASEDSSVYAYNDQKIIALSSSRDVLWSYTIAGDGFLDHLAVDSNGIYLVNNSEVIGLDLNGQEQWVLPSVQRVNSIAIGDDGTLYLRRYDSVTVLRPQ